LIDVRRSSQSLAVKHYLRCPTALQERSLTVVQQKGMTYSAIRVETFSYRVRYSRMTRRELAGTFSSSASVFNFLFISGEIAI
jgi:hypothetical protein